MKRVDVNKMKAAAESWTEAMLAYQIGLPAPFTFVSEVVKLAVCVALGAWLL